MSICRVLREQGCQVAARTYRPWRSARPAARTVTDAHVVNAVRDAAWCTDAHGRRRLTAEGLYGRRKMVAYLRRTGLQISAGSVDRASAHRRPRRDIFARGSAARLVP